MLCKIRGCQEPAVACGECGTYICQTHGRLREPNQHGIAIPGTSEPQEWLCQECAEKLAQRVWSRLSN